MYLVFEVYLVNFVKLESVPTSFLPKVYLLFTESVPAPFCRFCTVLEGQISGKRTPTREPGRPEWVCSGPGVPWYHAYRLVWP